MEGALYLVFIILVVYVISMSIPEKINQNKKQASGSISSVKFRAKRPLSEHEQALFFLLKNSLPDHVILSKVTFSQFLFTIGGKKKQRYLRFSEVKNNAADFLVCNSSFHVIGVVELNGETQQEEDKKKEAIFKEAGLKIIRLGALNMPDVKTIRRNILGE